MRLSENIYLVGSKDYGISHAIDSGVYLVDCGVTLALVDAGGGGDVDRLVRNIEAEGIDPSCVSHLLLTHCHSDHAGGAFGLRERLGCRVCIEEGEARIVESGSDDDLGLDAAREGGFYPQDYRFTHCPVDFRLRNGDTISCGDREFKAIHVPGHSKGSMCFLVDLDEGRALFSGDVVFPGGRIFINNLPSSDLSDYRRTIGRLAALEVDMLFPAHGVFRLSGGQRDIDTVIENLQKLKIPPNFT